MIIIRKIKYGNLEHQVRECRTSLQEIRDLTTEIVSLGAATNKAAHWLGQMVDATIDHRWVDRLPCHPGPAPSGPLSL
jgi:hypothetical protein